MKDWNELASEEKTMTCKNCKTRMDYTGSGIYVCPNCKAEEMDDFGKVKKYLHEHGPTPLLQVGEETGVKISVLRELINDGRLDMKKEKMDE
jgi:hypothetical protein